MKGKVLNFKVIITTLVMSVLAAFCFAFYPAHEAKSDVYAASTKVSLGVVGNKEEYSALFKGDETISYDDLIFSVEKVLVSDSYTSETTDVKTFQGSYDEDLNDYKQYYFKNIKSGSQNKTVIDNGQFAVLDNEINSNGDIAMPNLDEEQAVMVSFGAYVYELIEEGSSKTESVKIADKDKTIYSNMTLLNIVLYKDGVEQVGVLPNNRNINVSDGLFFDFVYLIKQDKEGTNEGHYRFNIKYMINHATYVRDFEFYIVNKLSYRQTSNPSIPNGEGVLDYGYNAMPTLGWVGNGNFEHLEANDYVKYYLGSSGIDSESISFPSITYDYTKYKLSYEHTANQKNVRYDFECEYITKLTYNTAQLNCTKTINGKAIKTVIELDDYDESSATNLITIILTEPGTYVVDYEYIYDGYKALSAPILNIEKTDIKLAIYGFQANYSKTEYEGARLQYFEFAKTKHNHVDMFIPNGYELDEDISGLKHEKLGVAYKVVELETAESLREGSVVAENSKNALINSKLVNSIDGMPTGVTHYQYLTGNIDNIRDVALSGSIDTISDGLDIVLNSISYVDTNQGSLWIEGNDTYSKNSFYFYSPAKIDREVIKTNVNNNGTLAIADYKYGFDFTNTTSFNSKGYYLVFLEVTPQGGVPYWQIFAMQYTSSSVDIQIKTEDGEIIAGGKYTNKQVSVSWKQPGLFDRAISGYYYRVMNNNASREQLLSTTKLTLDIYETVEDGVKFFTADLGSLIEVPKGYFVKYLIRLESEGISATHKMFTIDRQDISGVQAYLIEEMYSGNTISYAFATDVYNYTVPIINSITDSYATIMWDDKASGAEIYARYNYTPFAQNGNAAESLTGLSGKNWITTNYELGSTIIGASLNRADTIYDVSSDCVLFNQGIYIINIWDSAGNECYYAFIIDRTENYYEIQNQIVANTSLIYGDNVDYNIGDYKAFKLSSENEELMDFISRASETSNSKLLEYKNNTYYNGVNNNASSIINHFQKKDGEYYLTVANERVVADDTAKKQDTTISNIRGKLIYTITNGESYYKRTLYAQSANNKYSTNNVRDGSFVIVEINKDNARGMVYYSNSYINNVESSDAIRLDTGSDYYDEFGNETSYGNGMNGGRATSANNVAFIWNMGSGIFEVAKVYYTFYSLNTQVFNTESNGKYVFYNSPETFEIYNKGWVNGRDLSLGDGRALYNFNGEDISRAGLYVVVREYKEDETADWGDDDRVKKYYFFVDRNGVIDYSQKIGNNIKLSLLENEIDFDTFSISGTPTGVLNSASDDIFNQRYNIYLSTTKLPVIINVPMGKYFLNKDQTSASYYAGQLNVKIFFNDVNEQLDGQYKGRNGIKIFDSANAIGSDGMFEINIYRYLSNVNQFLRDRITESDANGTWIFMSGEYVMQITDNSFDTLGNPHSKYIGFKITGASDVGPQVDSFTGYKPDTMNKIIVAANGKDSVGNSQYSATVSQEYLEVVLPVYESGVVAKAQVDPNYIVIRQFYGHNASAAYFFNHPYEPKKGNLKENSDIVTLNEDGTISLWLDTKLRDASGNIDVAKLNIPLYYTITVRYKIGDGINHEKYKNCYVYYNTYGVKNYFYEAVYTIRIDREAPTANINMLNKSDVLVQDYNNMFGTENMIESGVHETSSNLYFTKQYSKYYQDPNKNKSYIYAYQVNDSTKLDLSDVKKIFYKKISGESLSDLSTYNLTLPLINEGEYLHSLDMTMPSYAGLGLVPNNYYEIIEQDAAGNTTQYIVHYNPSSELIGITLPVNLTQTNGKNITGSIGLNGFTEISTVNSSNDINIYDLSSGSAATVENELFFKIEIKRTSGDVVFNELTTSTTDFTKLNQRVVNALREELFGNFKLYITARNVNAENPIISILNINMYDKDNVISLNVERLVKDPNGNFYVDDGAKYINLHGANVKDNQRDLWYFATKITIKSAVSGETSYVGSINSFGRVVYWNEQDVQKNEVGKVKCEDDTIYYITMVDVLGQVHNYRFSTTGRYFYQVSFANPQSLSEFGKYYSEASEGLNTVYYGYTNAIIEYDTIFTAYLYVKVDGKNSPKAFTEVERDGYNVIVLEADYNDGGKLYETQIDLYDGKILEKSYYVTIDTRLSNVALRDYNSGEQRDIIKIFHNTNFDDEAARADRSGTGIMNLLWEQPANNSYFDYQYIFHELMQDGNYRTDSNGNEGIDVTGETVRVISTAEDSKGIYKFEIRVYAKDGTYLGNRVFSFEVQKVSSQIYYVRNQKGEAIAANSSFAKADLVDLNASTFYADIKDNINLPLYISNQNLSVIITAVDVEIESEILSPEEKPYTFTLYKLSKEGSFSVYLGIMIVKEKQTLLTSDLYITGPSTNEAIVNTTYYTITGSIDDLVQISTIIIPSLDLMLNKNELWVDIYYDETFVKSILFTGNYTIEGNGQYKFVFRDLAGNIHVFENGSDNLEVYVLREVVVMVNGEAPIPNAFYNDAVNVTIYASTRYVTGSISIVAKRNGVDYRYRGSNPYIFSDYGTYRITITADYNDGVSLTPMLLRKVITFTIVNVKEARNSIDLTSLNGSKIIKVQNPYGEDKTEAFLNMINSSNGGMNITYQKVIENSDVLNVSAGKITFTLTYVVSDDIYPDRIVNFSFTLNNETPQIECSIKKGDSTTKGFKVYLNPAIVYAQIGEAVVYINDRVAYRITENSINEEISISTTYKEHGEGDYYIRLVSSSGVVWDSYKVTIKEPLNFWAIVVIIAIVGVVGTVVTTIIILRRKMRIR